MRVCHEAQMKTISLTITIVLLFSICSFAQKKLPSDTFRVIKDYQPTLTDAQKITFNPEIDDDFIALSKQRLNELRG